MHLFPNAVGANQRSAFVTKMISRYASGATARPIHAVRRFSRELKIPDASRTVDEQSWCARPSSGSNSAGSTAEASGYSLAPKTTAGVVITCQAPRVLKRPLFAISAKDASVATCYPRVRLQTSMMSSKGLVSTGSSATGVFAHAKKLAAEVSGSSTRVTRALDAETCDETAAPPDSEAETKSKRAEGGRLREAALLDLLKKPASQFGQKGIKKVIAEARNDPEVDTLVVYNAAIFAYGTKKNNWGKALELFRDMPMHGVTPDVITYNTAMNVCGKHKQWRMALELLRKMPEEHLAPDVISYTTVMKACDTSSQWEITLELLAEMRAKGVTPNILAYNTAINSCWRAHHWEKAVDLLKEMWTMKVKPRPITYKTVMKACGNAGQWETAVELLREMSTRGVTPEPSNHKAAMLACAQSNQWVTAIELLRSMKTGVNPEHYSIVMMACVDDGQWDIALELLREMPEKSVPPGTKNYKVVLDACAAAGEWEMALELMREMSRKDITVNAKCYHSVMKACGAAGQWAKATELLAEMHAKKIPTSDFTYRAAIKACQESKPEEAAAALADAMALKEKRLHIKKK